MNRREARGRLGMTDEEYDDVCEDVIAEPVGAFLRGSPDLDAAYELCAGTGISLGSYGAG